MRFCRTAALASPMVSSNLRDAPAVNSKIVDVCRISVTYNASFIFGDPPQLFQGGKNNSSSLASTEA